MFATGNISLAKSVRQTRAERLNRVEERQSKETVEFIEWQKDTRQKLYEEKLELLRRAVQLMGRSTGRSIYSERCSTPLSATQKPSTLLLGQRRFQVMGPLISDQSTTKSPKLRKDNLHIGWDSRNNTSNFIVNRDYEHEILSLPLTQDKCPSTLSVNLRNSRFAHRQSKVQLPNDDFRFVGIHLSHSDRKIAEWIHNESRLVNRLAPVIKRHKQRKRINETEPLNYYSQSVNYFS